ncbi:MAG: RecQ family ATP-dependent DNA helicase, partial [Planctomycetaceae bacterium]
MPLTDVLSKYWGFDRFLPLQEEAMRCVLNAQDSVVVLPTGGGKSLCFQAPALCLDGLAVVASPLISLMKDQVDALRSCGIPAACLNSSLSREERRDVAGEIRRGRLRLLYAAPEWLVLATTIEFLKQANVSLIAIDEAHCISAWGHDFRPEYRELRVLREAFPEVGIHAYTATATVQVREDIARELCLTDPKILVGSFDRPNLIYKVERRTGGIRQICEIVDRHSKESGIVYCITRAEVDRTCATLTDLGYRALPYHAGMDADTRRKNQEAFIKDDVDIIVATVAFGMGIDKPNVRYVIHAGMPKSIEHYQQESGRAGRDGLEAECCLLYSSGDYGQWRRILESAEAGDPK